MKTVVQRVSEASVVVEGECVGRIGKGLLLLVGVERGDEVADAHATARKVAGLRIFPGRKAMDLCLQDVGGACLVVSQFTLAGTVKKGRRPSFDRAEDPARARQLYEEVAAELERCGIPVQTGNFGANMQVGLVNDGPATFLVGSADGTVV